MPNCITWNLDENGGVRRFTLQGEITEEADFAGVLSEATGPVVLNLAGINRINSCGVREWITFLQQLSAATAGVALEACSPVMVRQLSMIATMRQDADVTSILVPYFCESCDDERTVRLALQNGVRPELAETTPCPECEGEMDLDDTSESYLAFLG